MRPHFTTHKAAIAYCKRHGMSDGQLARIPHEGASLAVTVEVTGTPSVLFAG